ncbi:MAG: hypothetical protein RRY36_04430 [Bacteroidaceae bacterium]
MKKTILFSSLVALALTASAQNDITPDRFKFQNWPVGALSTEAGQINSIDAVGKTKLSYAQTVAALNHGGVFQVFQGAYTVAKPEEINKIKSGLSIIDLGGEAGKALCFKGSKSTYDKATIAATEDLTVAGFTLAFYPDPAKSTTARQLWERDFPGSSANWDAQGIEVNTCRANAIIRTVVEFKIVDNNVDANNKNPENQHPTVEVTIALGNGSTGTIEKYGTYSLSEYKKNPETGISTGKPVEERWYRVTTEAYINQDGARPYILYLSPSTNDKYNINEKALVIRSIKMTNGYRLGGADFYANLESVGTDQAGFTTQNLNKTLEQKSSVVNYAGGASGIDAIENANKPFYSVSGNQVTLDNLVEGDAVAIYSVGGQPVDSFVAKSNTATLSLQKGYYLAKIGKETLKLVVY